MAETSRNLKIAIWIASGLMTALFLAAGSGKVMGAEEVVATFTRYGHSDGFRIFIGASELAGAIGLWIPRLGFWAAAGLIVIMIGAVYTHLTHAEAFFGPVVAALLLAFVAWSRRSTALLLS
jgi:uncharacterized membrane protein YphA (DoxX/SURF4 family)